MNLLKFPFYQLANVKGTDFENIRRAVKLLRPLVGSQDFYSNPDNCVNYTIDFILGCCSLLTKNSNCDMVIKQLLILLEDICASIKMLHLRFEQLHVGDVDRIIDMLNAILDSGQQNHVKVQATRIIALLIYFTDITSLLTEVICKCCNLLDQENSLLELLQFLNACFVRKTSMEANWTWIMVEWVEINGPSFLHQETDVTIICELLKCLNVCYEINEGRYEEVTQNVLLKKLQGSIALLCYFMNHPMLREQSELLLTSLLHDLHYNRSTLTRHSDKKMILNEVQNLPSDYQQWFHTENSGVIFSIAYLQFIHNSQCLWTSETIWFGINQYCSRHLLLEHAVLKCLLFLYPLTITHNPALEKYGVGTSLIGMLESCICLSDLLTYHPVQMVWLLRKANIPFKMRLLVCWLQAETDDNHIKDVLETNTLSTILVLFLLGHPDSSMACRVANLIIIIKNDPYLKKAVDVTWPLFYKRPTLLSMLIQVQPSIPSNPNEILTTITMISASVTSFTSTSAIQTACNYCLNLLTAMKEDRSSLLSFCRFSSSIRFLVVISTSADDDMALAAINLLWRLIKIQIQNNVRIENEVPVCFYKILQGKLNRLLAGLNLIKLLLTEDNNNLLLTYSKDSFLGTYHLVQDLMEEEIATESFTVLRLLLIREPNLAFSLSTLSCLRIICQRNFNTKCAWHLLRFLYVWLSQVTKRWYCNVPVDLLLQLLRRLPYQQGVYMEVLAILHRFNPRRDLRSSDF